MPWSGGKEGKDEQEIKILSPQKIEQEELSSSVIEDKKKMETLNPEKK